MLQVTDKLTRKSNQIIFECIVLYLTASYSFKMAKLTTNILRQILLLLPPNTGRLQQSEDYVRGGTTSTKYWQPSTSWKLCQRWYYFYQIVTAFNKLKIMSEVVLLLPNTDSLQQVEDYVRGGTTSTKYWQPSTSWRLCRRWYYFYQILTAFNKLKIMSEVVLLLPNTDSLQQVEDYVGICSTFTSTKYWPPSTTRLCQKLHMTVEIKYYIRCSVLLLE
jgi:uncharacterized protein (DUF1499 family)